jgi:transposase
MNSKSAAFILPVCDKSMLVTVTLNANKKRKCGPGTAGKTLVFSLLKPRRCVYQKITPNACSATLLPFIKRNPIPDKGNNINRIERLWNQSRRYMCKFNGASKAQLGLLIKKIEWRFGNNDPSEKS